MIRAITLLTDLAVVVAEPSRGSAEPVPLVESERPVSDPELFRWYASGHTPKVASVGDTFLAVWESRPVMATRVSATGEILDPDGISITTDEATQIDVAWTGSAYLVTWMAGTTVKVARVSAGGAVLDPGGFVLATAAYAPSVAEGGPLVVYTDARKGYVDPDVYGARIDVSGTTPEFVNFPISTAAASQSGARAVWTGSSFLVAWNDTRTAATTDVWGARVDGGGALLDPDGFAISTTATAERVAGLTSGSSSFLVIHRHHSEPPYRVLDGIRLGADGRPVGVVRVGDLEGEHGVGVATSPGGGWDVAWGASIVHVPEDGGPAGDPLPVGDIAWPPGTDVAATATVALVGWTATYGPRFARVASGAVLDDPPIAPTRTVSSGQGRVDVAADGDDLVVAWNERGTIRFGRLAAGGTLPNGRGVVVGRESPGLYGRASPRIASAAMTSLVVWEDLGTIRAARVGADGAPLGGPIALGTGLEPAVASGGPGYLVAWTQENAVRTVHVGADGVVSPPSSVMPGSRPAVAWNGSSFLVVGVATTTALRLCPHPVPRCFGATATQVVAARVAADGSLVPGGAGPVAVAPGSVGDADVASNGDGFLVAWSAVSQPVVAAVPAEGPPVGAAVPVDAPGYDRRLVWTGAGYMLVRSDYGWIIAAPVGATGRTGPDVAITQANVQGADRPQFAVADGASGFFVAYTRTAFEDPHRGAVRAFARTVTGI